MFNITGDLICAYIVVHQVDMGGDHPMVKFNHKYIRLLVGYCRFSLYQLRRNMMR